MQRLGLLLLITVLSVAHAADLSHEIVYRMADGRQYAISNPQNAVPNLPLILYYHGINTPCTKVTGDILDAIAAQNFPALVGSVCGVNSQWDINGQSDIDFTHRVLADIKARYNHDTTKVFLSGWSMGGMMCSRIACKDGGIAAGIAMVDCAFSCDNFAVKTNLMGVEAFYDSVCVNWVSPAYANWAQQYGCSAGAGDTRRQTCGGKYLDLDRVPAGHSYVDVPNQVAFFKKIAGSSPTPTPTPSGTCTAGYTQLVDQDAPNNDLSTTWGVNSVADCQTICTNTAGCVMFTYNAGLKGCWAKSAVSAVQSAPGFTASVCSGQCTAGFTQMADQDAANNDISTTWGVTAYEDCQTICTKTPGCAMFTFNAGLKGCWTKSKVGTLASAPGFTAGVCTVH